MIRDGSSPRQYTCRSCMKSMCRFHSRFQLNRREFLAGAGMMAASAVALPALPAPPPGLVKAAREREPIRPQVRRMTIQPVLTHEISTRREATSWRNWGGIQNEREARAEKERIARELSHMVSAEKLPADVLSVVAVQDPDQAAAIAKGGHDVLIIYAAGGPAKVLEALTTPEKWNLVFVRHQSGPVYLWYEIVHPSFLRKQVDSLGQPGLGLQDVVVDSYAELAWRLRALCGLKNTLGKKIIAVGGPGGWGADGQKAPGRARELWKLDIVTVPYPDLGRRIREARQDSDRGKRARSEAEKYLKQKSVSLETTKEFVHNAFLLAEVFKEVMDEAQANSITVNECMSTIIPMAETTACLSLSVLNDEGYLAFCESDFVAIPAGILLHHISSKPVFLNDPTYPHEGVVTLAHCTAPRMMDGEQPEPVRIMTHFESDYGAAPKVEMRKGQVITVLDPDFDSRRWLGFQGEIIDNPFYQICRSQIDVRIKGHTERLLEEMRGFHWMASYGNHLRETGYALSKVGVDWVNLSA